MRMSIVQGIDDLIDKELHIENIGKSPHYKHKTSCLKLSKSQPSDFDAFRLLESLLDCVEQNWQNSPRRKSHKISDQNWRWEKKLELSPRNSSDEKQLEKTIAKIASKTWSNQIPTASGLYSSNRDRHRNIDLAQDHGNQSYSLIELKVKSDTPLFAAMEIVTYAILYIFARKYYPADFQNSKPLLQAQTIQLRVLAPRAYYVDYNLDWLNPLLNKAFKSLIYSQQIEDLNMDFDFLCFPAAFRWPCNNQELLDALAHISSVKW